MRDGHPSFDRDVPADAVLWRYMDFPKFLSMLKEGALWFSRADLLGAFVAKTTRAKRNVL